MTIPVLPRSDAAPRRPGIATGLLTTAVPF